MLAPAIDFLQKPFNSQEFLAKIREILNRQQESRFPVRPAAMDIP
jgi:DNA-binding response OmpR family regulator